MKEDINVKYKIRYIGKGNTFNSEEEAKLFANAAKENHKLEVEYYLDHRSKTWVVTQSMSYIAVAED